jgi:hypothetical protein
MKFINEIFKKKPKTQLSVIVIRCQKYLNFIFEKV